MSTNISPAEMSCLLYRTNSKGIEEMAEMKSLPETKPI